MSLLQIESTPFKQLGQNFKNEPVELFQRETSESQAYLQEVQGENINPLFIGWICRPRTFFAYLLMSMKREAKEDQTTRLAADMARAGFEVVMPQLNEWIANSELPVILIPVASRYGACERITQELHRMLEPVNQNRSTVGALLERLDHSIEIKSVYTWPERARAVKKLFAIKSNQDLSQFSVLLVDDFVSSGSSLRESARLLKSRNAKTIAAAALATNLFIYK